MRYFIGDAHLRADDSEFGLNWSRNGELLLSYLQTLPLNKEDEVYQLGDWYDRALSTGRVHKLSYNILKYLTSKVSKVYLLEGNHGSSVTSGFGSDAFEGFNDNLILVRDIVYDKDSQFLLCPFIRNISLSQYQLKIKKFCQDNRISKVKVIMGHAATEISAIADMPFINVKDLGVEFDYAIFGDIHKPDSRVFGKSTIISSGSVAPQNKGELHKPLLWVYNGEEMESREIPSEFYINFRFLEYPIKSKVDNQDKFFTIVRVVCETKDKFVIEKEVREQVTQNLYDIEWTLSDSKTEEIKQVSEDDLEKQFFKENKFKKEVVDKFYYYVNKEVEV